MNKISQPWDEDEEGVNWMHDVLGEGERLRVGISQDQQHIIFKFSSTVVKSKAVKIHYKDLVRILVDESARSLEERFKREVQKGVGIPTFKSGMESQPLDDEPRL